MSWVNLLQNTIEELIKKLYVANYSNFFNLYFDRMLKKTKDSWSKYKIVISLIPAETLLVMIKIMIHFTYPKPT